MFTNPIWINTAVVFVRLYWFEKRFQHVVKQSMEFRKTRTKSQARPEENQSMRDPEKGVGGRRITVDLTSARPLGPGMGSLSTAKSPASANVAGSSSTSSAQKRGSSSEQSQVGDLPTIERPPSFHRTINFADEVASPTSANQHQSEQLGTERHIAFVENQKNAKEKGTLRIPGPRESDRGQDPEMIHDESHDDNNLGRTITEDTERLGLRGRIPTQLLNRLRDRRAGTSHSRDPGEEGIGARGRLGTIMSTGRSTSREPDPIPYLSWQPTVGRNSTFIDLTEEQREELGGIEYRSLKTLAVILVAYFVCFHLLGIICLLPWILRTDEPWGNLIDSEHINRVWW